MSPIERAARALCTAQGLPENTKFEGRPMWESFVPQARAVLEAIREPSERMIISGIAERHEQGVPEAWSLATENVYRAMIDAALSE